MNIFFRLSLVLCCAVLIMASCTKPSGGSFDDDNSVIDITKQADSTSIPETDSAFTATTELPEVETAKDKQFDTLLEIVQNQKELVQENGNTDFLWDIESQCHINGTALKDLGGELSPIPLLSMWEWEKVESIDNVEAWASHGTMLVVKGIRKSDYGNWYRVELAGGGMNSFSGWVPEALITSQVSEGDGNYTGTESSNQGVNRARRGRGGGRGPGG